MVLQMENKTFINGLRLASQYWKAQQEFNEHKRRFEETKKRCFEQMDKCFEDSEDKKFECVSKSGRTMIINKVEPTKIVWNVKTLEKRLPKSIIKKVLVKNYSITNMQGLMEYLKSCGVDPKEFKKYISVDKQVDNKQFEQLNALGEVNINDLDGCYTVENLKSYYKVTVEDEAK